MKETRAWTQAERDIVKRGCQQGLSARLISAQLRDRSRSSVISLATREGYKLGGPRPPVANKIGKRRKKTEAAAPRQGPLQPARSPDRQVYVAPSKPPPPRVPLPAPVAARHLSVLELREGDCRYPVSGERSPFTFCGAPAAPGSSWCPHHGAVCISQPREAMA